VDRVMGFEPTTAAMSNYQKKKLGSISKMRYENVYECHYMVINTNDYQVLYRWTDIYLVCQIKEQPETKEQQ
jgi:hypothetical protein